MIILTIYITGDTHGSLGIKRLGTNDFPEQYALTKDDYVIIAGDFGLVFHNSERELFLRKWLESRSFTTLFLDGNHENFDLLDKYPVYVWNGGKVSYISDHVIHLKRGQVFEIDGKKIFTFGGGKSIDKHLRTPGITWWEREMPNTKEEKEGLNNLKLHNCSVDYIITHDCSERTFDELTKLGIICGKYSTRLSHYLEEIEEKVDYTHWYFGHHHKDVVIDDRHTLIYQKILELP